MIGLTLACVLAATPPPLTCPRGAERQGAPPPAGYQEWCEVTDPAGKPRREGPLRTWYDDGGVWLEQSYRDGLLDGPMLERHRNGKTARQGAYDRGRKVGTWRAFFESGQLEEEAEWREGFTHGAYVAYWPSGARRTEGRHCGGVQCGRWRNYDAQGKLLGEIDFGDQRLTP